jgi:hypothetical protein
MWFSSLQPMFSAKNHINSKKTPHPQSEDLAHSSLLFTEALWKGLFGGGWYFSTCQLILISADWPG